MINSSIRNSGLRLALFAVALCTAVTANAAIFEVDTTEDLPDDGGGVTTCHTSAGTCSLRAAIMKSNALGGVNQVHVPAGLYVLTIPPNGADGGDSGDLNIESFIDMSGAGAGSTIIDANGIDRVIHIASGSGALITNMTIRNGSAIVGGGILGDGSLTIGFSVIEGNQAVRAAGIDSLGQLVMIGCTVRSNFAVGDGGGLFLEGPAAIRESAIYGNGALYGGGIDASSFSSSLVVVNSTISGNYANSGGGGLVSETDTSIYNTSIVGNDADHDHDEDGGIGGGIYATPGPRFIAVNSLVAGNTQAVFTDNDCGGTLEVYGWNVFGVTSGCAFSGNGDASQGFVSVNTIGPLQDNGGLTWTHALLAGSEAIDSTIDSVGCVDETGAPLDIDQRSASRIAGARCDVGAFEFGAVVDTIFADSFDG